ncbi:hypothetical protein RvY_11368 [Ramazzottius varieornatus]|uniref:BED-type domain-containing protein n=1 Tax=Ramazzottius varieornatus TaxID=947166 RepID=A0A1D1VFW8_RAMVA|nr:hypothetical protein RvY_11368 [Ramazzottius varieornatus]
MPLPTKGKTQRVLKKPPAGNGKFSAPTKEAVVSPAVINITDDDVSDSADDDPPVPSPQCSSTSSSVANVKHKRLGGPKRASAVWQHYTEDVEIGSRTCQYCLHEVKPAGNTGNAVAHLRNHHPQAYGKYEEQEKCRKDVEKSKQQESSVTMIQPKLSFESSHPYEEGSFK